MFYICVKFIIQNSHLRFIGLYGIYLLLIILGSQFDPGTVFGAFVMLICFVINMLLADRNFFGLWHLYSLFLGSIVTKF